MNVLISQNMHIKSVLLYKISNYLKVNAEIILKLLIIWKQFQIKLNDFKEIIISTFFLFQIFQIPISVLIYFKFSTGDIYTITIILIRVNVFDNNQSEKVIDRLIETVIYKFNILITDNRVVLTIIWYKIIQHLDIDNDINCLSKINTFIHSFYQFV